jgi:hypothetical protein
MLTEKSFFLICSSRIWRLHRMIDGNFLVQFEHLNFPSFEELFTWILPNMHLHMIQEHNAQVSLNTNENERENMPPVSRPRKLKSRLGLRKFSLVTKQKYYSCSQCDFKSKWLNNLCDHELKVHNISQKNGQTFGNIHANSITHTASSIVNFIFWKKSSSWKHSMIFLFPTHS